MENIINIFGAKYDFQNHIPLFFDPSTNGYRRSDATTPNMQYFGETMYRPGISTGFIGFMYYDTTLNKPIWWNGTKWVDSNGNNTDFKSQGTFAQKPSDPSIGFAYFCTDKQTSEGATNGIIIYYKGNDIWVDALGREVN